MASAARVLVFTRSFGYRSTLLRVNVVGSSASIVGVVSIESALVGFFDGFTHWGWSQLGDGSAPPVGCKADFLRDLMFTR